MTFDFQLRGQRALVTGGTKGVGAAVVQASQDAGVKVMTAARSVPEQGHGTGGGIRYLTADLSTAEAQPRWRRPRSIAGAASTS